MPEEAVGVKMSKQYWVSFYENQPEPFPPSLFAKSVLRFMQPYGRLCELGCGNGRDSVFFAKHNLFVTAVDCVEGEIEFLKKNYSSEFLNFVCKDFTDLKNVSVLFDYVYCRFSLHAIEQKEEDKVLQWIFHNLVDGGYAFFENRSIHDAMLTNGVRLSANENFTDHYRRYIDMDLFCEKLKSLGFSIVEASESDEFAPHKDERPMVIRVTVRK